MPYTGKVFSFNHNWVQGLKEQLHMPCDVQVADDGTEIRRSLRFNPLRSYEISVLAHGPMRAYFDAFLDTSLIEEILFPILHDGVRLSATLPAGSTSLEFDTSYLDLDAGSYVLFHRDYKTHENVEITDVTPEGIEFEETETEWPIGTKVFAARPAKFNPNVQGVTIATDLKARTLRFDIDPRSVSANRYGSFTWPTVSINGTNHNLWLKQTESSDDRQDTIEHQAEVERTLTGLPTDFHSRKIAPYHLFDFHNLCATRAEVSEWLAFWKSRYGRRVPFWMPSWEKDFIPVSYVDGVLTWQENGYTEFYNLRADRTRIFAYEIDRTYTLGQLTTCEDNGDGTESGNIVGLPALANLRRLSYLRYCRLDNDVLDIDWFTAGKARSQTTFRELFKTP